MQRSLLCAALLTVATTFAQPGSLRDLAEHRGIRIGTAVAAGSLKNEPAYAATLARESNQAGPENAAKFGPIRRV